MMTYDKQVNEHAHYELFATFWAVRRIVAVDALCGANIKCHCSRKMLKYFKFSMLLYYWKTHRGLAQQY